MVGGEPVGARVAIPSPLLSACPRCASPLLPETVATTTPRGCARCGGIWLDTAACAAVMARAADQVVDVAEMVAGATQVVSTATPTGPCPDCGSALARRRFVWTDGRFRAVGEGEAARAGFFVDLDLCGAHGTFLVRGELPLIAKAIAESQRVRPDIGAMTELRRREAEASDAPVTAGGLWDATVAVAGAVLTFGLFDE